MAKIPRFENTDYYGNTSPLEKDKMVSYNK